MTEKPQKSAAKKILMVLGIIVILIAGVIGKDIAKRLLSPKRTNFTASSWKSHSIEGIILDCPIPLQAFSLKLPDSLNNMVSYMGAYEGQHGNFSVRVLRFNYHNSPPTLDSSIQGSLEQVQKSVGYDFKITRNDRLNISGVPAYRCLLEGFGKHSLIHIETIGIRSNKTLWLVQLGFQSNDSNAKAAANRVLNSVKLSG